MTRTYHSVILNANWNKYGVNRILYDGIYKYFKYQKKEAELYNLENDPAELDNLIAERFAVTARMGKKLEDWEKHYVRAEQKKIVPSQELIDGLKSLGYIQ